MSNNPVRIHILHKLPTPYNDFFFRTIHSHGMIRLNVHHLWRGSWRRPWVSELGSGYPNEYMRLFLGVDWRFLHLAAGERESLFIIADWGHLTSLLAIVARYLRRSPVSIWTDTPQEATSRSLVKRWLRSCLLKWLLPRLDVIFGTGEPAKRVLKNMGARTEQIVNLPCFVDLDQPGRSRIDPRNRERAESLRETAGASRQDVVFSMVGTMTRGKGCDIGIRAFAECVGEVNTPIGLLIAGEGPELEALQEMVKQYRIGEFVTFLGWQEPWQMDALYMATDVVIHPARIDAFPLVVLETMNWSKVVVGSDTCGSIEDRVAHGVNGFSFPSEDSIALARIMVDLVNNAELRRAVGKKARKTAEEWPASRGVEILEKEARRILGMRV